MATWGPTHIADGNHNGYETPGGTVGANPTDTYAGAGYYAWFCFVAPDLAADVTINSAYFRCYVNETEANDLDWLKVDSNKTDLYSSSRKPSLATYVSAGASIPNRTYSNAWYFGAGDTGEINIGADIALLLPLTTSNYISIVLYGSTGADVSIEALANAGSNEAQITINYTEAASGQPRMARMGGLWVPAHYAQGRRVF